MKTLISLAAGLGGGAGLMYFLDSGRGRRRRGLVRDTMTHLATVGATVAGKTWRDVSHRGRGFVSTISRLVRRDAVGDDVLAARVRAALGRVVSHPHALAVTVADGQVTLRGPILAREVDPLLARLARLRGVTAVDNRLEVHQEAGQVSSLQGGEPRTGERSEFLQTHWSPAARLIATAAGGVLALYGLRRGRLTGVALGAVGGGLLVRGLTNLPMRDVVGLGDGRGIGVQKTITIHAPVGRVYELWSHHENFPQFMSRVREVTDLGHGRYRWTVLGPAGTRWSWVGTITRQRPNEVLEFASEPGSAVWQRGVVRFEPTEDGGTRIDIKMAYRPPAGAVGHLVARLFGADPRSEITADLLRMKSFIETGHAPHDAAAAPAAVR